jgi:hypothetical protein
VVGGAGEGESVDVGGSAGSPVVDVVDVGEVAGDVAAVVFGVEHDALVGGGDSSDAAEVEGPLGVLIEDG